MYPRIYLLLFALVLSAADGKSNIVSLTQQYKTVTFNQENHNSIEYTLDAKDLWKTFQNQQIRINHIPYILVSKSSSGAFTEKYSICQLEMNVHGTTINTDWIHWSANCTELEKYIQHVCQINVKPTQKASFYLMTSVDSEAENKIFQTHVCYKKGEMVIQYIDTMTTANCPAGYQSSGGTTLPALPPTEKPCLPVAKDVTVTEFIDGVVPKTVQCAFGPDTTSSCVDGTWDKDLHCEPNQSDTEGTITTQSTTTAQPSFNTLVIGIVPAGAVFLLCGLCIACDKLRKNEQHTTHTEDTKEDLYFDVYGEINECEVRPRYPSTAPPPPHTPARIHLPRCDTAAGPDEGTEEANYLHSAVATDTELGETNTTGTDDFSGNDTIEKVKMYKAVADESYMMPLSGTCAFPEMKDDKNTSNVTDYSYACPYDLMRLRRPFKDRLERQLLPEQTGRGGPTDINGVNMGGKNNPQGPDDTRIPGRRPGFGDHLEAKPYEALNDSTILPSKHKYSSL